MSYIYLCQGDYQLALEQADKVLQFNSSFPPGYKFLCQLYAAEAHMKLGHINESVIMLDPKKVHHFQDVSFSDSNNSGNNGNNGGGNGNNQENKVNKYNSRNFLIKISMKCLIDLSQITIFH